MMLWMLAWHRDNSNVQESCAAKFADQLCCLVGGRGCSQFVHNLELLDESLPELASVICRQTKLS